MAKTSKGSEETELKTSRPSCLLTADHGKEVITSDQTLQTVDSYTCGHYALLFLKAKARNVSFQEFLAQWNSHNLVLNDRRAGEQIQHLIKTELSRKDLSCQQSNVSRSCFCYFYQ